LSNLNREEEAILLSWARDICVELSVSQINLFGIYLDELCEWNRRMNLTGLTSRVAIIRDLLLDSLFPARFLPEEGWLLDVGSGAGFPAIPLKICKPKLRVHLIEASLKKVSFLKQVIRRANLGRTEVIRGRIEADGNLLNKEGYNIITARALAHLPKTLTWCAPYLKPGGLFINFQGSRFENALREGRDVLKKHRIFLYRAIPYRLPGKDSERHLLIFKKNEREEHFPDTVPP
jgi:16S rRNA (guanine527-N7)-methyltransferase